MVVFCFLINRLWYYLIAFYSFKGNGSLTLITVTNKTILIELNNGEIKWVNMTAVMYTSCRPIAMFVCIDMPKHNVKPLYTHGYIGNTASRKKSKVSYTFFNSTNNQPVEISSYKAVFL